MRSAEADRELSKKLTSTTKKHIAPIFQVNPVHAAFAGTGGPMLGQGTMTFISYQGRCFGITNQHVIGDFERVTADRAFVLALNKHQPLPGRLIFSSTTRNHEFPHDVAVFILDQPTLEAGGKTPVMLVHEANPVKEGERYLGVGYPGALRTEDDGESNHPIYHIVMTDVLASERQLIFNDELTASSDVMKFGGISGGAIFDVAEDDSYTLAGIIFEGRGQHDEVDSKVSATDIWVYGIPISTHWMDYVLNDASSRQVELNLKPLKFKVNIAISDDLDHTDT
ncbi:trypsin-like peptidase domain-containing protein [Polaromonas aquatica]|uniref:trypsin-like peptidase domain-containing protein n=1 Tax=Polaromonas aquatica TaxID=332657 RepID=UPI003D64662D